MRPRRTRANLGRKMGICTTDPIFQPRIPFISILAGDSPMIVVFTPPCPVLLMFPDLCYFLKERTSHREKLTFGIFAWKHSKSVIRIFRVEKLYPNPQCAAHTQAWVGRGQGMGAEHRTISSPLPSFPQTLLPHPPFLN